MKAPLWLRFAWREIANARGFALAFVLNLSLGLLGFLVLDAFKSSVGHHLEQGSKASLAADLRISARRPLTDAEQQQIKALLPPGTKERYEVGMVTMARTETTSRLVEIRAIDNQFPFYGTIKLAQGGDVHASQPAQLNRAGTVWIYPELTLQLGVNPGDEISIGTQTFQVNDVITSDPSMSSVSFTVAPKVFMGIHELEQTGLIQRGSRVTHAALYKLPVSADVETIAATLKQTFANQTDIRIATHQSASEQMARLLIYLNDYLGLVALVALFLAAVGSAYLFRSFLSSRVKDMAILLSVGMHKRQIRAIYLCQLTLLGFFATFMTISLTAGILPFLPQAFGDLWLKGLTVSLRPTSIAVATGVGVLSSILYCLPMLVHLSQLSPASLFQEDAKPSLAMTRRSLFAWLPAIAFFWILSIFQAQSLLTGSLFVGLFLGSGLLMGAGGMLALKLLRRFPPARYLPLRLAVFQLSRRELPTLACFLAVALGALLVNLIPQIRGVLEEELLTEDANRPSLFLFDIQEEQREGLEQLLSEQGSRLSYVSPLIRARYESLNGNPVSPDDDQVLTREDERAQRMRNRTYNLSYRDELAPSETIVAGNPFSTPYQPNTMPEISVEERFADRVGLKIGDVMGFDIQGVFIEGKIVNLRRVKWTSFHPNFFVQFQPGVLDDAPKMFVSAIPHANSEQRSNLQTEIVKAFPNVSVIDVTQAIERILVVVGQMTQAIKFMAALTLLAGLFVLFSIANHQARSRQKDLNMLKVLGTPFRWIRTTSSLEFLFIGWSAAMFGAVLSLISAQALAHFVFDSAYTPTLSVMSATLVVIPLTCIGIGLFTTSRQLMAPPLAVLKGKTD